MSTVAFPEIAPAAAPPESAVAGASTTGTNPAPLSPASSATDDGGASEGVPWWLIALAIAALGAGVIWGGWLRYRRRLP